MKIITISIILIMLMPFSVFAELTKSDLRATLANDEALASMKDQANSAISSVPSYLNVLGKDRIYEVKISGNYLTVIMKESKITSIKSGRPAKPTHQIITKESTVISIINSDNLVSSLISALMKNEIIIKTAPACTNNEACAPDQVCKDGECKNAYTLLVVPIAYSSGDLEKFKQAAEPEIQLLKNFIPMESDNLRIHYVDPKVCPDYKCKDVCRDCQSTASQCAIKSGLATYADKVLAVSKDDVKTYAGDSSLMLCGCAGGIPSQTSVSRARVYVQEGVYCYNTVPHEFGHQVGLYHINAEGSEEGSCQGPNAADCKEADKKEDIMGYAYPQDHFGPAATSYLTKGQFSAYQE
jgi:hypothetical protein